MTCGCCGLGGTISTICYRTTWRSRRLSSPSWCAASGRCSKAGSRSRSDEMEQGSTGRVMDDEADRLRAELDTANRKLGEAHKMASVGRLSAGIVHEINTPIGSIFSNNEVTVRSLERTRALLEEARKNGQPPAEKALALMDTMIGLAGIDKMACERMSGIIRSLKTFARVTADDVGH